MSQGSFERIRVDGFLSIKRCNVQVSPFTAFIGPQASGKSVLVKLIYYCREYLEDFFIACVAEDFSLREFKRAKNEALHTLFKGLIDYSGSFSVTYSLGTFTISIEKQKRAIKFEHSTRMGSKATTLRRQYSRYQKNLPSNRARRYGFSVYEFQNADSDIEEFYKGLPSTLFVPASRSFYSTISQEVFEFLRSERRIDPLTAQFGSFYDFARRDLAGELYREQRTSSELKDTIQALRPVLKGDYFRRKRKDFIRTEWGEVPLDGSSSGQQESLPLLLSILRYPDSERRSDLLIIEEPEAHLFPESQKYVLDLIIEQGSKCRCGMMFTTHSPYILACLNNYAVRVSNSDPKARVFEAYYVSSGRVKSLVSKEDGLIDLNELDKTSERIANEFMKAALDE